MKNKILIFTCLFTFILSIGLFGHKASANEDNGYWYGTMIEPYKYCENIYFNTNLSVDEVVAELDKLTFISNDNSSSFYRTYNGYDSLNYDNLISSIMFFRVENSYAILDENTFIAYFVSDSLIVGMLNAIYLDIGYSLLDPNIIGWLPNFNGVINVSSYPYYEHGFYSTSDGSSIHVTYMVENYKITSLISSTPFEYVTNSNGGFTQEDINNAYADGYDNGWSDGIEEGNSKYFDDGYNSGYKDGFTAGKELFIPVNYFTTAKVYHGLHGLDLPNYLTFEPTDLFGSGVNFKRFTDNIDHRFNNSDSESSLHKIRVEFDENYRPSTTDFVIGYDTTTTFGVDVTLVFTDGSQYQTENDSLKNVIDLSQDLQFSNKVIEYIEICGANIDTTIVSMYNLNSSFMDGYNQGYDDGHYKGYNSGNADGYKQGYDNGYNVGIEVNGGWNLKNLFWTIAALPFESFKSVWNFEFLGFNIAKFFTGFLMVFIVLYIIKRILK